jgi:hypothetical protein
MCCYIVTAWRQIVTHGLTLRLVSSDETDMTILFYTPPHLVTFSVVLQFLMRWFHYTLAEVSPSHQYRCRI